MDTLLDTTLGRVVAVIALVALAFFLLSLYHLWRGNRAPYWRARRAAGQRGGQLFLIAFTLFGLAGALAFFGGLGSVALDGALDETSLPRVITATPGPTRDIDGTVIARVDATIAALPTSTPPPPVIVTATTRPTLAPPSATPTPVPPTSTATPTPTVTPDPRSAFDGLLLDNSPVNAPTPGPDASLSIDAVATGIRLDAQPANAGTRFDAGFTRLYVFFSYAGMSPGAAWSYRLYLDGRPVAGATAAWEEESEGDTFAFIDVNEGFPPGSYTMRLYTGEREADRQSFTIVGADA